MTPAKRGAPLIDRMMARVLPEPNSGCWLWTGGLYPTGYGMTFLPGGKPVTAHRAMMVAQGVDLQPKDVVMHTCDVRCCVNPDHLRVGTQADNMADMMAKGRHRKAYALPVAVRQEIRDLFADEPARLLAMIYGVSVKTIRNIRKESVL